MSDSTDKLVDDYLDRLEQEFADFPAARRRELVQEISGHIAEARAALDDETEADVRNLLDRIGDPADIAEEARERPAPPARKGSALDIVALIMLLLGGVIVPLVGWLVGVVLLWISEAWSTREKLFGTIVVPGGLALPIFVELYATSSELCVSENGGPVTCGGGRPLAVDVLVIGGMVVLLLAPFVTTIFLARRRSRALALR
jgi:uncharacterized membrane protein